MRIFKGLENIHSVIDRHEAEWRAEQGEDPELLNPESIEERVRRRLAAQPESGSGRFDEDRFLGGNTKALKRKDTQSPAKAPESEESDSGHAKGVKFSADRFLSGSGNSSLSLSPELQTANDLEAVEIIKNNDGKHSWLYNEVMKAINDASKGSSAKIIAVFIPVVQNGKEFEDLPADETVTTSPIDESLAKVAPSIGIVPEPETPPEIETSAGDFNLIPEIQPEQKAEIAETLREMEEKFDEVLQEEAAEESPSEVPDDESLPETFTEESLPEIPAEESDTENIIEDSLPEVSEDDTHLEVLTEEALPEIPAEESEPEITDDNKEDKETEETGETEAVNLAEEVEPEIEYDDDDDILQEGEVMESEELPLNDELNDDEVFDESLTEVLKPDDDESLIAEGDELLLPAEDEIELIPDPKK